jgi:hypothetical protein
MSARRYGSSACVYGVDQGVDGFDCFVEVDDRHVETAGHGGVAVAPVGVGGDLGWPLLLITCSECALAGVLDGREVLAGEDLEELQVDDVPVTRVLPAGSQRWLGDGVQLLGYLPAARACRPRADPRV